MRILVSQVRYYIQFNLCLVLELFVVPYYFDCNGFVCFVIIAFDCLPKWTFTQKVNYFEPECEVVAKDNGVITLFIIVPVIVVFARLSLDFLISSYIANKINLVVVQYLGFLEVSHLAWLRVGLQTLSHCHWKLWSLLFYYNDFFRRLLHDLVLLSCVCAYYLVYIWVRLFSLTACGTYPLLLFGLFHWNKALYRCSIWR